MRSNFETTLDSSALKVRYVCHLSTSSPDSRPLSSAIRTPYDAATWTRCGHRGESYR